MTFAAAARAMLVVIAALGSVSAQAAEYQIHGFLAQGFVLSEGNNLYGDSEEGSLNYYEAGLNGTVNISPNLLLSAQGILRDAGATDDGKPRLDFAFVDYRLLSTQEGVFGFRVGRVKNSFGLFNETRDVVFTRPSILLPFPVYYETQGARSLLFSSDGAQIYGGWSLGSHYPTLVANFAPDKRLSESAERQLGEASEFGNTKIRSYRSVRLQDDWDGGRWSAAISYVHGVLDFLPDPSSPFDYDVDFNLYMLSLRYSAERYRVTAEYSVNDYDGYYDVADATALFNDVSDGFYIQLDYLLDPYWTLMGRYEAGFSDRGDRDGSECKDTFGSSVDSHQCFAHDVSVGVSWRPDDHWGVWAEYHLINGTESVSSLDNEGRELDPHWSVLLLMAAYRF